MFLCDAFAQPTIPDIHFWVLLITGEDVSANKDGGVLKSRIKNGQGVNPPKDGAVCNGR